MACEEIEETNFETVIIKMENITNQLYIQLSLEISNRNYAERFLPSSILLISFIVLGVLGNTGVISVYILRSNLRTYGRYFIPYLAILDILSIIFGASIGLMKNYKHVTFPGDELCKIFTYFVLILVSSSLTLLLLIAVQRYFLLCRPYERHFSLKMRRILLFLSICCPSVFFIPFITWNGTFPVKNNGLQCGFLPWHLEKSLPYRIVCGMVPMLEIIIVTFIYIKVWMYIPNNGIKSHSNTENKLDENEEIEMREMSVIKSHCDNTFTHMQYVSDGTYENITSPEKNKIEVLEKASSIYDLFVKSTAQKSRNRRGFSFHRGSMGRTTTVFFIISAVGFVSYLPSSVITSLEIKDHLFFDKLTPDMFLLCSFLRVFYLFNHLANPFIYGVYDAKFRKEFISLYRSAINKVCTSLQN